jgi:glycerophosphoryl diester phosphodiesterase
VRLAHRRVRVGQTAPVPHTSGEQRGFLGLVCPVGLAHRGSATHPENSAAAFAEAVALGYRVLETDVHVSADGKVVALHDPTLDRTTDGTGPLASLAWEQVARLHLLDAGGEPTEHHPVRLADLLDAFGGVTPPVRLNIDVKEDGAVGPVVELLASRPGDAARVCVASFSDARRRAVVGALARRGVRVTSSAGTAGVLRFLVAARLGLRGRSLRRVVGADALQVPERAHGLALVSPRLVRAAHYAGLVVHVWTVDDPARMRHLLDTGVDGIVTDDAAALAAVLRERGAWPPSEMEHP